MGTWKEQQNEACKAQGVWFPSFMVLAESFSILPANKQQHMSGAKAILRYTAVSNEGEMLSGGGGLYFPCQLFSGGGGWHVFHGSFFLGRGGMLQSTHE